MTCAHLGRVIGHYASAGGDVAEHACKHPNHSSTTLAACETCLDRTLEHNRMERVLRHPLGVIKNLHGLPVDLRDQFYGSSGFVVLGGPSAKQLPLELLGKRGAVIISMNNCPGVLPPGIRPNVWLHTDPTHKMHDGLWKDPLVQKFSPIREWAAHTDTARPWLVSEGEAGQVVKYKGIRTRTPEGRLEFLPSRSAREFPNVFGYERNTAFDVDNFLWEPSINRGNDQQHHLGASAKGIKANGWPHVINSMFSVLKLSFYLGFSRLYLLGCDFRMEHAQPYGHGGQTKEASACNAMNETFAQMSTMFDALRPKMEAAGLNVYNCYERSGCWSFDYLDFREAIDQATGDVPQVLDTAGWYDEIRTELIA